MTSFIAQKEIKEFFEEYIRDHEIDATEKKNFKDFLRFLEIDIYDWFRENLRCYFRGKN